MIDDLKMDVMVDDNGDFNDDDEYHSHVMVIDSSSSDEDDDDDKLPQPIWCKGPSSTSLASARRNILTPSADTTDEQRQEEDVNIVDNDNTNYHCYLLHSINAKHPNKTYIGFTNDPYHRLRQHNGIIKGGARKTTSKRYGGQPWDFTCVIGGFPTNIKGLQFEWVWQHIDKSVAVKSMLGDASIGKTLKRKQRSTKGQLLILKVLMTYVISEIIYETNRIKKTGERKKGWKRCSQKRRGGRRKRKGKGSDDKRTKITATTTTAAATSSSSSTKENIENIKDCDGYNEDHDQRTNMMVEKDNGGSSTSQCDDASGNNENIHYNDDLTLTIYFFQHQYYDTYNNLSLQGVIGSSSISSSGIEPPPTSSRLLSSSSSSEVVAANSDNEASSRTGAPTVTVNTKLVSSVKEMPFYVDKLKAMEQRKLNKKLAMKTKKKINHNNMQQLHLERTKTTS